MKRYYILIALTPLVAFIVAELTAWLLWPGYGVTPFWVMPWTIAEYTSWHYPFAHYALTRALDWVATKQGGLPTSTYFNQWLRNTSYRDLWHTDYYGFLYWGAAACLIWGIYIYALTRQYLQSCIKVGNVKISPEKENLHFLFPGSTQSGKTSCILQMLSTIRRRGDPAILIDPSGELVKHFYKQGGRNDRILSPGDQRSEDWAHSAELAAGIKAELLSERVVGQGYGNERQWCGYTHGVLRDIYLALWERGSVTNSDVMSAILSDNRTLSELLKGRPSAIHFFPGNEKFLLSLRSILANYTAHLLEFNPRASVDAFALAQWIRSLSDANGKGNRLRPWLFFNTSGGDLSNAQKQLLSAQMSIAIHSALSLPVDRKRRIWFVLEELGNIGAITGLKQMLAEGAKHGVCAVAAIQSVSQLVELYGEAGAQTLLSCFNSTVVSRLADPKTAEYYERHFGKKELTEWRRSEGSSGGQSSSGLTEQVRIRPRYYSHELMELDGKCITWIVGDHPKRRRVPKMRLPEVAEAFVPQRTPFHPPVAAPDTLKPTNPVAPQGAGSDGPKWEE